MTIVTSPVSYAEGTTGTSRLLLASSGSTSILLPHRATDGRHLIRVMGQSRVSPNWVRHCAVHSVHLSAIREAVSLHLRGVHTIGACRSQERYCLPAVRTRQCCFDLQLIRNLAACLVDGDVHPMCVCPIFLPAILSISAIRCGFRRKSVNHVRRV